MNIRNKLVIPTTGLVIVFAVVAVVAMNMTVNRVVTTQTDTFLDYTGHELAAQAEARKDAIYHSLDRLGNVALQQAALFSEQPDVLDAYRIALSGNINDENDAQMQRAREELRRTMAPYIFGYKKNTGANGFKIHFHTPSSRSLARLWRDGWQAKRNGKKVDISDDLSSFRKTVTQINQGSHSPLKGIEIGRGGFALRGLAPITDTTGEHLGSCEVLLPFADVIKINHGDDSYQIAAYMLSDLLPIATKLQDPVKYPVLDGKYVLTATTDPELTSSVLTSALLDAGRNEEHHQVVGDRFVSTFPIPDFSGEVVGVMALVYDMTPINAVTAAAEQRRIETLKAVNWRFGIGALVLATILFLTVFQVTRLVVRPLNMTIKAAKKIAEGDLPESVAYRGRDEVGTLADAVNQMIASLKRKAEEARRIAEGDLTLQIDIASDRDVMGKAFRQMTRNLNAVLGEIESASTQIDSGSDQVANTAQVLSQGAMDSAASLEEITSSMNEVGSQTRNSAGNAEKANQLAQTAQQAARTGSDRMTEMVLAMKEINEAGQNINNIIKVIDEIAFQTNLLALNAAVEAARAGQHGKGFAVVAEEVRNLAARSAKAAEETAQLIEGSVEKAGNGGQIAQRTSDALAEIVEATTQVTDLIGDIATSANEQAQGIEQINQGLEQIDTAVQHSTATAEESAAAAEELASQSTLLKRMLGRFTLAERQKRDGSALDSPSSAAAESAEWEEMAGSVANHAEGWEEIEVGTP